MSSSCFGYSARLIPWFSQSAEQDFLFVKNALAGISKSKVGYVRVFRPQKTAAFSTTDSLHKNFATAKSIASRLGYEPILRPAGGHLAIYDHRSLILDITAPHDNPGKDIINRYELFSEKIATYIGLLGVDARIGQVDGEFCPGRFSINSSRQKKLVGIAQRITKYGYYLSALILLEPSPEAIDALSATYKLIDLDFDPSSHGDLHELVGSGSALNWEECFLSLAMEFFEEQKMDLIL